MMAAAKNGYRRVVVTGLGVVSSLGIGWQEFWKNLIAGKSGISEVTSFDTSGYERHYGGEIKNFDPAKFMNRRKAKLIGRSSQMAIAASKLALEDAGLALKEIKKRKIAVCIGTTTGEQTVLEGFNDLYVGGKSWQIEKRKIPASNSSSLSASVAKELGISPYCTVFSTACAAGNYALGYAFDLIRSGRVDFAIAGGTDAFSRLVFAGFGRLYAIAPEKCQPFDKNRKGMIPGEGSGMLILEPEDIAISRKAHIYTEIMGYGMSCDGMHMANPAEEGIAKSIEKGLTNSKVRKIDVDYISAHGTGTIENDRAECGAYRKVFGDRVGNIPINSIKSMLGHTMGAAAAIEAISCCLTAKYQEIPPTINYSQKDEECDIDCVPNKSKKLRIRTILNNSQAFGGNNFCTIMKSR